MFIDLLWLWPQYVSELTLEVVNKFNVGSSRALPSHDKSTADDDEAEVRKCGARESRGEENEENEEGEEEEEEEEEEEGVREKET